MILILSLYFFLKIFDVNLNSFFLISPVSTIIHFKFDPIALLIISATTTLLSTPPDKAQTTLLFLTSLRISLINSFLF